MSQSNNIIQLFLGGAGQIIGDLVISNQSHEIKLNQFQNSHSHSIYYLQSSKDETQFNPLCLFIDSEAETTNQIKKHSPNRQQYADCSFNANSNCNFSTGGMFSWTKNTSDQFVTNFKETIKDNIRRLAEQCGSVQGFNEVFSTGGGTAAGLQDVLGSYLSSEFPKKYTCKFPIVPSTDEILSELPNGALANINSAYAFQKGLENYQFSIPFDNAQLYSIYKKRQKQKDKYPHVDFPYQTSYKAEMNEMVAHAISKIQCHLFSGQGMHKVAVDLIPYPRINNIQCSLAPIKNAVYSSAMQQSQWSEEELMLQLCHSKNAMLKLRDSNVKTVFFSPLLAMFQGQNVRLNKILQTIQFQQEFDQISFYQFISDWQNRSSAVSNIIINNNQHSINSNSSNAENNNIVEQEISAQMLVNSNSITQVLERINHGFDLLYCKRAFVHFLVGDGCELGELVEMREDLAALVKDYECGCCCCEDGAEDEVDPNPAAGALFTTI